MSRLTHSIRLAGLLVSICICGTSNAGIKVAFLAPDPPGQNPFWTLTITLMQAAAADLDVDLEVTYTRSNTYSNRKEGLALLRRKDKPDYFLTGYWAGATGDLLEEAERQGVYTLTFNTSPGPEEKRIVGRPRGKYKHWLGQIAPDDRKGGFALADMLIRGHGRDNNTHIIGLGGNHDLNDRRYDGLSQYVEFNPNVVLDRYLFAGWSQKTARNSLLELLTPGTPVSVIWSSNDTMAIGAIDAAHQLNKTPGKDIFIGGFGWSKQAIEAVANGEMYATLGGHFLEGAWALILLYDYHNKHDFADDLGLRYRTTLKAITAHNAQDFLDKIVDADWNTVDFKQFSKVYNPQLKKYQWPLDELLEQLGMSEKTNATGG